MPDKTPQDCPVCGGKGYLDDPRGHFEGGRLHFTLDCETCNGTGKVPATSTHPPDKHQRLIDWWKESNGTGTESCKDCLRNDGLCTWHSARLDDLEAIIARTNRESRIEAQTNAVAWAVGEIDRLHEIDATSEHDRIYKGIKNTLRDNYAEKVGTDPAPSYPIHVALESQTNNGEDHE